MTRRLRLLAPLLVLVAAPAGAQGDCFTTSFAANNGGALGGALYLDLATYGELRITHLESSFDPMLTPAGTVVGLEIHVAPVTAWGNTQSPGAWTLVATGTGVATGIVDEPSRVDLAAPLVLPPGMRGVALVAIGGAHDYSNSCGISNTWDDGNVTMTCVGASNVPFTGTLFQPRLWNGRLCYEYGAAGASVCGPATPNSTGASGEIVAIGSVAVFRNELRVEARALPAGQFALFLTSRNSGLTAPPGTIGTLCLGGAIGRYAAPGQVRVTDAAGRAVLRLDLAAIPGPTGTVAAAAGETRYWQCWHRDSLGGSNLTDAVEVDFR